MDDTRKQQRVVVGITGGIAAYKSADLVRRLRESGFEVRVVMTRAACAFITPLTLQALSGHPVHTSLLDEATESSMGHIELARWADMVIVAPASANTMAKLSHGLADELLPALCLTTTAPIVLVPAMNQAMWKAPATQANQRILQQRGVQILGPAEGDQACGETGPGRMLEPTEIVKQLVAYPQQSPLAGRSILITAGPTWEAIDPVRFITNHSSGKMGYAIARAATEVGANTTLVSGPTRLEAPQGVELIKVASAEEMYRAVMARVRESDIFIAAAAVADYRPATYAPAKIKKRQERITLELERTPDILATVAGLPEAPFTVGFAAETEDLEKYALAKLAHKSLDLVAANTVGKPGIGFESDENILTLFWQGGHINLPKAAKSRLAHDLVRVIGERYHAKDSG